MKRTTRQPFNGTLAVWICRRLERNMEQNARHYQITMTDWLSFRLFYKTVLSSQSIFSTVRESSCHTIGWAFPFFERMCEQSKLTTEAQKGVIGLSKSKRVNLLEKLILLLKSLGKLSSIGSRWKFELVYYHVKCLSASFILLFQNDAKLIQPSEKWCVSGSFLDKF